jgi:enoyl-CoA hydratase
MHVTTLDGPGKNALGSEMLAFLIAEAGRAGGGPWLLTGAGDAFSAGLDLREVGRLDNDGMSTFLTQLEAMVATLWTYPGPTAAAVNGHAIAGGCVVAACCDHRVAAPGRGRIGLNEVAIGLRFPPNVWHVVTHRIPPRHHTEVLLGAGLFSPQEAYERGLVDALADDPVAAATAWLTRVGKHPADAYRAAKANLRGLPADPAAAARFLAEVVPAWTSDHVRAQIDAALNRGRIRAS